MFRGYDNYYVLCVGVTCLVAGVVGSTISQNGFHKSSDGHVESIRQWPPQTQSRGETLNPTECIYES